MNTAAAVEVILVVMGRSKKSLVIFYINGIFFLPIFHVSHTWFHLLQINKNGWYCVRKMENKKTL